GEDPLQLTRLLEKAKASLVSLKREDEARGDTPWDQRIWVHARSALEVACLDYLGKRFEVRVCDLLGGAVREAVPFGAYLFYKEPGAGGDLAFNSDNQAEGWAAVRQMNTKSPDEVVRQAKSLIDEYGFQSIKLKGGVLPPDDEADAIFALRDSFGKDVPLRLDPNAVWSVETGIRIGKKLDPVLEYLEDPVRGQENMALVGKAIESPLATNMCTTSFEDIPNSVRLHSEDVILTDHHYWGGLKACIDLCRICQTFGRGISMHSNSHLGLSLAAMVHLGACIPQLDYDLDTHYPWQSDEIIKEGRLPFENGAIKVPDKPGLGVTLDHEAIAVLHQNYLNFGVGFRNDEVEMQKIEPGWKFQATRW
ncbi:MAG: glucarate dehydratase, partial [Opitutales bacterium]|nr:glucarate dehydratase [Opitutales bacterium]